MKTGGKKVEKRMDGSKENILSIGGRIVANTLFLRPKEGFCKGWNIIDSKYYGKNIKEKTNHVVNCSTICGPKDSGGLTTSDIEIMNSIMLWKWLWKLENTQGVSKEMVKRKYMSKCCHISKGCNGSPLIIAEFVWS